MRAVGYKLGAIDSLMLDLDRMLEDGERASATREQLIRESFAYHLQNNANYRSYVERLIGGRNPEELSLAEIPLLPSSLFKQRDLSVTTGSEEQIVKLCCSSGTSGSRSIVPRDDETLTRFLGSVTTSIPSLFGVERTGGYHAIVLGPSTEEAGDLWFSYVIACMTLIMTTDYLEQGGVFSAEQAVTVLARRAREGRKLVMIGPPFRILEVCRRIAGAGAWPGFPPDSFVISAGGWKDQQAKAISPPAFRQAVRAALKMKDETAIRDSYNMVELNSVINECEANEKHVPPWVEAQARDPRTDRVLSSEGELGVLAFLDASSTSYPGFILSEDFGHVVEGRCGCGRIGQRVQIVRRINRIESRGCALKMATGKEERAAGELRFFRSVYRAGHQPG
ncbi:MAG: hypothetical protein HY698_19390 [Deltaproteobacteria bacterium]|nr:hypothetical protein [Deltaproteobacteria bacterium]